MAVELNGLLEFFAPQSGVGVEPLGSSSKVEVPLSPVILNRTANLDPVGAPLGYPVTKCDPKFIVLQCNCGRHIVPSSCMQMDCTGCADGIKKRRSSSVFRRLVAPTPGKRLRANRRNVLYTVFTVPPDLRPKYRDPKEWQKVRKKAWRIVKENFGGLYGVEASHPSGDKDPSTFHPHLNFLWVQRPGFRPFLEVNELRKKWQNVLGVEVGDVYTRYHSNVRKIKHWCNYVCRTFPGNHKWTGPLRWYGTYPKSNVKAETICGECEAPFKCIGWIDKFQVDDYYKRGFLLGIDPPWEKDDNVHFFKSKKSKS